MYTIIYCFVADEQFPSGVQAGDGPSGGGDIMQEVFELTPARTSGNQTIAGTNIYWNIDLTGPQTTLTELIQLH